MLTGKLRVLVVDDDGPLRRVLHRLLGFRYDVVDVATAEEALALICVGVKFDAILCDLRLDGMSGADLRTCLERIDVDQARRLLLHTGRARTAADAELLADADERAGLVIKPAPVEDFVRALEDVVERHGHATRPASA
jgi:two-component system, OmpR family, KDP operon response regulator KdpE